MIHCGARCGDGVLTLGAVLASAGATGADDAPLRLKRHAFSDPQGLGGEAFSVLIHPNFNPNVGANLDWQRIERRKP